MSSVNPVEFTNKQYVSGAPRRANTNKQEKKAGWPNVPAPAQTESSVKATVTAAPPATVKTEEIAAIANNAIQSAAAPAVSEGVRGPTAKQLEALLESLKPILESLKILQGKINDLRNEAKNKEEACTQITVEALEDYCKNNAISGNDMYTRYTEIAPKITESMTQLEAQIKAATRTAISAYDLETFSSQNEMALFLIKENIKNYEGVLRRCRDTLATTRQDFKNTQIRFYDASGHINRVFAHIVRTNPELAKKVKIEVMNVAEEKPKGWFENLGYMIGVYSEQLVVWPATPKAEVKAEEVKAVAALKS